MPPMHIDPQTGTVGLPNGYSVDPSLTQDGFRASALFSQARSQDHGTWPWIHYHFSGGHLEGKELLVSLCFYDQVLVYLSMTADLYPPGPKDWSTYSLAVEAAIKDFHDRLLEQTLGKPSRSDQLPYGELPAAQATLAHPHIWELPWGTVHSAYDSKGGDTSIIVKYGNRHDEANKAFRARRGGS